MTARRPAPVALARSRRDALAATRDAIAARIDHPETSARDLATLARAYLGAVRALDALAPEIPSDTPLDILAAERAARGARVAYVAGLDVNRRPSGETLRR